MSPLLLMLMVAVAAGMLLRLKRVAGLGETLATTLVGLATRIAATFSGGESATSIIRLTIQVEPSVISTGHL